MGNKSFFFVAAFVATFFHYGFVTAIIELGGSHFAIFLWAFFGGAFGVIIMTSVASMRRDAARWRCKQLSEGSRV